MKCAPSAVGTVRDPPPNDPSRLATHTDWGQVSAGLQRSVNNLNRTEPAAIAADLLSILL